MFGTPTARVGGYSTEISGTAPPTGSCGCSLLHGALWEAGDGDLERPCLRVVPVYQQPPEAQRAQQSVAQGLHMFAHPGRSQ